MANTKVKSAKEYVEKAEWYRSEYFIDPKTGDVYDSWRPNIRRVVKGLDRFIEEQDKDKTFERALQEIRNGKLKMRCILIMFPSMLRLDQSEKACYLGITHRGEAEMFIEHPLLRDRLIEATETVYYNEKSVYEIFGKYARNVCYCMKLFSTVSDIPIFRKMMEKYSWH